MKMRWEHEVAAALARLNQPSTALEICEEFERRTTRHLGEHWQRQVREALSKHPKRFYATKRPGEPQRWSLVQWSHDNVTPPKTYPLFKAEKPQRPLPSRLETVAQWKGFKREVKQMSRQDLLDASDAIAYWLRKRTM